MLNFGGFCDLPSSTGFHMLQRHSIGISLPIDIMHLLNSLDFWPFPTIMKIGMSVRTGQTSKLLHRLALPNFHTMEMPHSHPFIPTPEFLNPKSCAVFGKDTDYTNVIRDFLFFRRNWKIYQEQKLKGENIYILNIKLNF